MMYSETPSGSTIRYEYDSDGMRTSKTVGGVKTEYYYSDGKLLYEASSKKKLYYTYDAYGVLSRIYYINGSNTNYYYPGVNSRGDVEYIYNINGELVTRYIYDSWGKLIEIQNHTTSADHIGNVNSVRYRGYYYDQETGMYYVGSRYYDPEVGRWLNAEAFLSTGYGYIGNNMYVYCLNNSVNHLDYNGFWTISISGYFGFYFGFGFSASISLVFDDKGNIDLQLSRSLPFQENNSMIGRVGYGYGGAIQYTKSPSAYDLYGKSTSIGASAGYVGEMLYHFQMQVILK